MAILKRAKSSIFGLSEDLLQLQQNIDAEAQARANEIGTLTSLTTTDKSSVVGAVNEVNAAVGTTNTTVQSLTTEVAGKLSALANLSDVADAPTALSNIGGINQAQLEQAIDDAKLALGTNYNVPDIEARDALTGLTLNDQVFVENDGDNKWAVYKPSTLSETGQGTSWVKLWDEDALNNSLTAAGIKAAYESNPNTNAFTDADKAKVGYITVTKAVDLDTLVTDSDAVLKAELVNEISGNGSPVEAPSTQGVVSYVEAAMQQAGDSAIAPRLATAVVTNGTITLDDAPVFGVSGIANFGTVRYTDSNGIAYDAPVIATGNPKVFTVSTDTANQWDGFTVQVQYFFKPTLQP